MPKKYFIDDQCPSIVKLRILEISSLHNIIKFRKTSDFWHDSLTFNKNKPSKYFFLLAILRIKFAIVSFNILHFLYHYYLFYSFWIKLRFCRIKQNISRNLIQTNFEKIFDKLKNILVLLHISFAIYFIIVEKYR